MKNSQKSKQQDFIVYWSLDIFWNLLLVIWNFTRMLSWNFFGIWILFIILLG
jgi:hypothetical protein